jgi:DNA-directed RNA polymerase specialized sigma24 family protein
VVVFLRYHEDLSDEEIARVIGRSTRVVRSLAWRAIDKLRREMSDDRV